MMSPIRFAAAIAACCLVTACQEPGSGGDDDAGCTTGGCRTLCEDRGFTGGMCVGGRCQCDQAGADGDADGDGDVTSDADEDGIDDGEEYEVDPCATSTCGPVELCGESGAGDGLNNDCDEDGVDEGCECPGMGVTQECFPGDPAICPPGMPCSGVCVRGVQTCDEFRTWGPCNTAVLPGTEACDGLDNDCDGLYDEDSTSCTPPVNCPDSTAVAPMSWVTLDGSSIYPGTVDSFEWEIFCPATIPDDMCPAPEDPASKDTRVFIVASGTYRARATIHVGDDIYTCEFALMAQGNGLRVELTWDTQGSGFGDTDVDFHLHRPGPMTAFFTADDCYYSNCKGSTYSAAVTAAWGLASTADLSACRDAPHGEGAAWVTKGACYNPRLDVDVITCTTGVTDPTSGSYCAPENINVDNPPPGQPFRIMVNYYSAHSYGGITNATVNVYCGGSLRATFGPAPLRVGSSSGSSNDNWYVADVQFGTGACGVYDCTIVPILTEEGDYVIYTGGAFGPPWSTF